jgi:hypothetical protein
LLGLRLNRGESLAAEQRLVSVEQGRQQGRKLDDRLILISRAAPDSDAEAASDRRHFREQAAFAHTGGALDDDHCFGALRKAFELGANQRKFRVAPMEVPRGARHLLLATSISKGALKLSNRRIM